MRHIATVFVMIVLTLAGPVSAGEPRLQGASFSDTPEHAPMPKGWARAPMAYPAEYQDADLVLSFGQQTYPALAPIVKEYAKAHGLNIVIQSGTCGISAGKLLQKAIDSGAFCCPPGRNDRLPELEFHTIAIAPIAVIVNAKNPLESLPVEQARRIFRGQALHWSDVSQQSSFNGPIEVVGRLHCKRRPGHWRLLLKEPELFSPTLIEVGVISDLIARVGQTPSAISIETPYMVHSFDHSQSVKILKLGGHSPLDTDYVASGRYPMYRTYSLTTWKNSPRRESVMRLISHLTQYIEDNYTQHGFIPVSALRRAGWKFRGDELVGEPNRGALSHTPAP